MFFQNKNTKTIQITKEELLKDFLLFNILLIKHIKDCKSLTTLLDDNQILTIEEGLDLILKKKLFIIIDVSDSNSYVDSLEKDESIRLFSISNIEDYIIIIQKTFEDNLKKINSSVFDLFIVILSNSYFSYINTKRQELYNLKNNQNTVFDYNYFGSFYNIKSLHKNLKIEKDINLKDIINEADKLFDRQGKEKLLEDIYKNLHLFVSGINSKDINLNEILNKDKILLSIVFQAREYITSINNDYIIPKGSQNAKNTLSIIDCLGYKYLPICLSSKNVEVNGDAKVINTAIIITTLPALLSRFKGTIGNPTDKLGFSDSHLGNFIKIYDDDNLYKEYLIVSDEDFQAFYGYVDFINKFFNNLFDENRKAKQSNDALDGLNNTEAKRELDDIILTAIKNKSTDIHLKVFKEEGIVNERTDTGIIKIQRKISEDMILKIIRMLADDSKVDNLQSILPQDGENTRTIEDKKKSKKYIVDLRLAFPSGINKVYIRLGSVLGGEQKKNKTLNQLGFKEENIGIIMSAIENNSNGLILVTGPTGSGKSTLLYTILEDQIPKRPEVHLLTAEDPIERILDYPSVEQNKITESNTAIVLLKSFLRQDPDWLLIGEIRDKELLSTGIDAAQTGHLTFSTLHTNSSVQSLDRLVKLMSDGNLSYYDAARENILSVTRLIVSVKLIPLLCPKCKLKESYNDVRTRIINTGLSKDKIDNLINKDGDFFKRNTKNECGNCDMGFKGRQVINDIMNLSNDKILKEVRNKDYSSIKTLFQDGMSFVNEGLIDIDSLAKNASK